MKLQSFPRSLCCLFISFFLVFTGCSTPILKMPQQLPSIIKEYKHITIPAWNPDLVNTGVYLNKGDSYSILADEFFKKYYLRARIGEETVFPEVYQSKSLVSGYLFLGSYQEVTIGIEIVVWEREDYEEIALFLEKMMEKNPDNVEISNALRLVDNHKSFSIAEAKASKEIQETKEKIQELQEEPQKEKVVVKSSPEKKHFLIAKNSVNELEKQEQIAQLQAKLSRLMETLAELKEMKNELAEEQQKTKLLTKELTEKGKTEKDLLAELERRTKTPPIIVIASPKDGSRAEIERIQLSGVAEDDQGVKRLDIFVNNKLLREKTGRGLLVASKGYPSRVDFNERIQLQRGINQIKIRALGFDGLSSEKDLTIEYIVKHKNIWAVVVGIDKYENVRQLRYAVNDAKAFCEYLIHHNQIPKENITLLLNKEASLSKLRSVLGTQLKRKAGKEDMVIIYYAGHGAAEKDAMSPDGDGLEKYLLPYNANPRDLYASALPMREIAHILSRIRSERLILVVDSCYSGASGGRTISLAGVRANISDGFLDRIASGKGIIILTASGANEVSAEDEKLKHGLFTYFLLEGLRGKADTDRDGLITVDEAYEYVSKHVPKATGQEQNPVKKGTVRGRLILGIVN